MTTGTVKWFNPDKGFGFIEPEDGSKDAFVHISAVERAGMSSLSEGQAISYELQPGQNGKSSAENLKDPSDDDADDRVDNVTEDAVNDAEDTDDDTDDESEKDAEVNE